MMNFLDGHFAAWDFITPPIGGGGRRSADFVEIHDRLAERAEEAVGIELFHGGRNREGTAESSG